MFRTLLSTSYGKSSEKPKPVQTVQTLLAAKIGNEKQKKKTPKRPNIEVSME